MEFSFMFFMHIQIFHENLSILGIHNSGKKKASPPFCMQKNFLPAPSALQLRLSTIVSMGHLSTRSSHLSLSLCH